MSWALLGQAIKPGPRRREAVAGSSTSLTMRIRPIVEILIVISVTGILLEVAKTYVWALVAAGVVAAVWLLARSNH